MVPCVREGAIKLAVASTSIRNMSQATSGYGINDGAH